MRQDTLQGTGDAGESWADLGALAFGLARVRERVRAQRHLGSSHGFQCTWDHDSTDPTIPDLKSCFLSASSYNLLHPLNWPEVWRTCKAGSLRTTV